MLNGNIKIKVDNAAQGKGSEMLSVSGITYTYDTRITTGNYLVDVKVGGKPVEDNKMYSIAANSFVWSQFKKFFGVVEGAPTDYKATGLIDRDAIIEYVESVKTVNTEVEKRVVDLAKEKK